MNKVASLLGSIGIGAGLMYILDPDRGERRRALIRDKAVKAVNVTETALGKATRDLSNRTTGLIKEGESIFIREVGLTNEMLEARIRSKLGRYASHPRAITVIAEEGRVTLMGPILSDEVQPLIEAVRKVRGVAQIDNQLEVHQTPDIPALQPGGGVTGERPELLQRNWSPAVRLVAGAAGGALAIFGMARRGVLGVTLGTVGLGLITRGVTNTSISELTGLQNLGNLEEGANRNNGSGARRPDANAMGRNTGGGNTQGRNAGTDGVASRQKESAMASRKIE